VPAHSSRPTRAAQGHIADLANHYDLAVELDPATGDLSVTGTLDIVADAPMEAISFLLSGGVSVDHLAGPKISGWNATQGIQIGGTELTQTQQLEVRFNPALARGDSADRVRPTNGQ